MINNLIRKKIFNYLLIYILFITIFISCSVILSQNIKNVYYNVNIIIIISLIIFIILSFYYLINMNVKSSIIKKYENDYSKDKIILYKHEKSQPININIPIKNKIHDPVKVHVPIPIIIYKHDIEKTKPSVKCNYNGNIDNNDNPEVLIPLENENLDENDDSFNYYE